MTEHRAASTPPLVPLLCGGALYIHHALHTQIPKIHPFSQGFISSYFARVNPFSIYFRVVYSCEIDFRKIKFWKKQGVSLLFRITLGI